MLKVASIFTDNMVLQRDKSVAVWGTGDTGFVESYVLDTASNVVGDGEAEIVDGKWMLKLSPMHAGGPYRLVVAAETGEMIEFVNVMVGEVFLAGGQSNMELELGNSLNGAEAVKKAEAQNVRFYYTPKVPFVGEQLYEEEKNTSWELCSPDTCSRWSAVAYYCAKELSEKLDVTVGVIGCNWGGTSASAWMSWDYLKSKKELSRYVDEYEKAIENLSEDDYNKEYEEYLVYQNEFDKKVGLYYQTNPNPSWEEAVRIYGESRYPGPMGPKNFTRPCGLYETMLSRVAPYTLKGFWFYQGEEDDHRPDTYKLLLETLIDQWRHDWDDETLPFLMVQLPVFLGETGPDYGNWPLIREAQMDAYREIDNTGIAVILELGDEKNIHPLNKQTVGERLAKQALYHIYGKAGADEAFGPTYCGYAIADDKVHIIFDNAEKGFYIKGDEIKNFELAGADKKYYPAKASLEGGNVVLSASEVKEPKYARYAWRNYCEVNFFGANKIPVAPFRTSREDGSTWTGSRNEN